MSDPIVYTFKADGAAQVAGAIKANNDALKAAEKATREAARASDALFKSNAALTKQRVSEEFKRQSAAAKEVAKAEREAAKAADQLFRTNAALSKQKLSEEFKRQAQAAKDLEQGYEAIALGAGGLAATIGLLGINTIKTSARFEQLGAALGLALGSDAEAEKTLELIQDFAANTPFQVEALTESFVKLVNRGFKPTTAELTNLGDLAASQAKDFDQLVEALLDAEQGEFERLKEFGIQAKKNGDIVSLSFKGVTQEIANTPEAIRAAILSFGQFEGVAGSLAVQSATLAGQFSNLQDGLGQISKEAGDFASGGASALVGAANALVQGFIALPDAVKNTVFALTGVVGVLGAAVAVMALYNKLNVAAVATETVKAIALQASTIKTNALAVAQAILAARTGTANAAQLAQIATLSKGVAQAGLFAVALGAIALNVASFQEITGAASETRAGIDEITDALNRLKESTAAATQGSIEGFANAEAAAEANRKAFEDNLSIAQKLIDKYIELQNLNPFVRIATGFRELGTGAEAALSQQEAAFAELTDAIENNVLTTFDQLKSAPNGLADATTDELAAFSDSVEAAIATLEAQAPVLREDIEQKQDYLAILGQVKTELDAVTSATGEGTDAIEDQAKALKQFREDAKRALQEQRDEQNLQLDRQREDEGIAQDRARADELAAIARQNAEEIAAIEERNSEENAARERANAEAIALLQEQQQEELQAAEEAFNEQEAEIEKRNEAELQRREQAFNRQQQSIEDQFQRQQQSEQDAFNRSQRDAQQEFSDRQNEEREAFEERIGKRRTAIERQIQLEFADSQEEQRRLQREFADEDAREKRRTQLENGGGGFSTGQTFAEIGGTFAELAQNQRSLVEEEKSFEEKQREDQAKFEQEQRLAQEQFEAQQRVEEANFNKVQLDQQQQFANKQLEVADALLQILEGLREVNQASLDDLRDRQGEQVDNLRQGQEGESKQVREEQETGLQNLRDRFQQDSQTEQRNFEDDERTAQREFEDQQRRDEANFKATQRALDEANAQTIAGILGSVTGAPDRTVAGRRTGGPVEGSTPYIVGEAGPELFVPKQSGYVLNRSDTLRVAAQQYQPPAIRLPSPVSVPQNIRGSDRALLGEVRGLRRDLKSFARPEQVININEPEDTMNRRVYQVIRAGLM